MAGNEEIFDTIVDPSVKQQLTDTATGLALLDAAFIKAANSANQLNEATATSKTPAQFAKNAEASNAATKTLLDNNEKARLSEIKLQQAREKAFDDYEAKLAKQQALQDKAQAKQDAIAIKETQRQTKQQTDNDKTTQKQLANQAKIDAAIAKAGQPIEQLKKAYADSRTETENLAASQGRLSQAYLDSNEKTKGLKSELDAIRQGYGDNTGAVGTYENALNRLGGILTSRVFRLAAGFLITDLVIKGVEALYKYIAALNILNPILTATQQAQNALDETFKSADYTKGVEGLEKLNSTIDLQKGGFASADDVINQYNDTIGKAFGSVDNLTDAQQGFVNKSKDYIRAIELESAANILLGQTSAFTADVLTKNQKLQDDIDGQTKRKAEITKNLITGKPVAEQQLAKDLLSQSDENIKQDKKDIADNLAREQQYYDNSIKALDNFYVQRSDLNKKQGINGTGNNSDTSDPIASLRNDVANQKLEIDKKNQQTIIDNEKQSLSIRIAAVKKFGDDESQIAKNNSDLNLNSKKQDALETEKINQDLQLKQIDIANATAKKIQELQDQAKAKERAELDEKLKLIKDNETLILTNEHSTFQQRLDAIAKFQSDSEKLINKAKKKGVITGSSANALTGGISDDVLKQTQDAQNKQAEMLRKQLEETLKLRKDAADNAVSIVQYQRDRELSTMQDSFDKQSGLLATQYEQGKIGKKKYDDDLLQLEDQYNIDRLGRIAFAAQQVLEIRQAELKNSIGDLNKQYPVDASTSIADPLAFGVNLGNNIVKVQDLTKNSGVPQAQSEFDSANTNLNKAVNKQTGDNSQIKLNDAQVEKNQIIEGISDLQQLQEDGSKALQAEYQHEIELLDQKKKLIEASAKSEIEGIQNSILSEKDKQNQINIINAQSAAAQAQIDLQEAQIKTKAAEAQKLQAETSIIENTAIAILKLPADGGLLGVAAIPIIAALGAAQLATVIAQPIPKFERGGLTGGGSLIWGERGIEMATLPSGERLFSPNSATYASMPKGTLITPHSELLAAVGKSANTGGDAIGWQEVVKALNRQKQPEQKRPYVKVNVYADRSGLRK